MSVANKKYGSKLDGLKVVFVYKCTENSNPKRTQKSARWYKDTALATPGTPVLNHRVET
jgi:hypothetical protein